jgi:hypothetical protein
MSQQPNLELKEKAKQYVKEKRWDYLLVNAYLETKHFIYWSRRHDFEEKWNIGLTNISSEIRTLECGYKKNENNEFLVANFNNIKFKIGGLRDTTYMPDGDAYTTLSIVLLIDEKVVLSARYSEDADDPLRARDYGIVSVEELHSIPEISELLEGIARAVDEKNERDELKRKKEEDNSYDGKFTFDFDEIKQKESVTEKLESAEILLKNANDPENQDNPRVRFLNKNFIAILTIIIFIFIAIFG